VTEGSKNVVTALVAKQAELAGVIEQLQRQLDQYRVDLTHIDGVLRILAADIDPEAIRPKRRQRRTRYFARNELWRLCLDILRTAAGEPLSTYELAGKVIDAKGFDGADRILRTGITEQVASILKRLHRKGTRTSEPSGRANGRWPAISRPRVCAHTCAVSCATRLVLICSRRRSRTSISWAAPGFCSSEGT
jgi:hypothetical protein